jgi:hypothetical protein
LRDPWTVHANQSRENNGSNEFLRVQQRSRSHACVACKAKAAAIAAAPGLLFTKPNTSGTFSLPKLHSFTVAEEEDEEEEDLEEDVLF